MSHKLKFAGRLLARSMRQGGEGVSPEHLLRRFLGESGLGWRLSRGTRESLASGALCNV